MFLKAGDNQLKASIYSINFYMRKVFLVNVKNNNNKQNFIHTKAKCNCPANWQKKLLLETGKFKRIEGNENDSS